MVNSISREGLVNDGRECSCHLNSIVNFSKGDQMLSIVHVGRGKLGWMTTSRLLEVRTLLGTKPRDGGNANTHAGCNRTNRMARIKLREDSALLCSRKGSHGGSG